MKFKLVRDVRGIGVEWSGQSRASRDDMADPDGADRGLNGIGKAAARVDRAVEQTGRNNEKQTRKGRCGGSE